MLLLNNNNMRCVFQYYAVCKEVKYILNVKHNLRQMLLITKIFSKII